MMYHICMVVFKRQSLNFQHQPLSISNTDYSIEEMLSKEWQRGCMSYVFTSAFLGVQNYEFVNGEKKPSVCTTSFSDAPRCNTSKDVNHKLINRCDEGHNH